MIEDRLLTFLWFFLEKKMKIGFGLFSGQVGRCSVLALFFDWVEEVEATGGESYW